MERILTYGSHGGNVGFAGIGCGCKSCGCGDYIPRKSEFGLRGLGTICQSDFFDTQMEVSGACPDGYSPVGTYNVSTTGAGKTTATIVDCAKTTLKKGSTGSCVQAAMYRLASLGYAVASGTQKIGDNEVYQIKRFQKDRGLTADGIIGKKTWAAMALTKSEQKAVEAVTKSTYVAPSVPAEEVPGVVPSPVATTAPWSSNTLWWVGGAAAVALGMILFVKAKR